MSKYAFIISIGIFLEFVISVVSNYLNVLHLKKKLSNEILDIYTEAEIKKSNEYIKAKTKAGLTFELISISLLFIFWMFSGFKLLDDNVLSLNLGREFGGIIYIFIIALSYFFISLASSYYHTFVIEAKFGFNTTKISTFISDTLKSAVLSIVLITPLVYLIINLNYNLYRSAWLPVWAVYILFNIIIMYLAPKFILPLFFKFEEIKDEELKEKILILCEKLEFPIKKIIVIDGSRRSTKANAFFTGFGANKTIGLYDTLLTNNSSEEILAIIAHEIGHYKKKHLAKRFISGALISLVLFSILNWILWDYELYSAFYLNRINIGAGLVFLSFLMIPFNLVFSIVSNHFSRKKEYEADEFAVRALNNKDYLINALKNLSKTNLSNLNPHKFYKLLNYSHPTILERIDRINKIKL